jgi:hypothetical protein
MSNEQSDDEDETRTDEGAMLLSTLESKDRTEEKTDEEHR